MDDEDDRMWSALFHFLSHHNQPECSKVTHVPPALVRKLGLEGRMFELAKRVAQSKHKAKRKDQERRGKDIPPLPPAKRKPKPVVPRVHEPSRSPLSLTPSPAPAPPPPLPLVKSSSRPLIETTSSSLVGTRTPSVSTPAPHIQTILLLYTRWADRDPDFLPRPHCCTSTCRFDRPSAGIYICQENGNTHLCGSLCNQSYLNDHQYVCALTGETHRFELQAFADTLPKVRSIFFYVSRRWWPTCVLHLPRLRVNTQAIA